MYKPELIYFNEKREDGRSKRGFHDINKLFHYMPAVAEQKM